MYLAGNHLLYPVVWTSHVDRYCVTVQRIRFYFESPRQDSSCLLVSLSWLQHCAAPTSQAATGAEPPVRVGWSEARTAPTGTRPGEERGAGVSSPAPHAARWTRPGDLDTRDSSTQWETGFSGEVGVPSCGDRAGDALREVVNGISDFGICFHCRQNWSRSWSTFGFKSTFVGFNEGRRRLKAVFPLTNVWWHLKSEKLRFIVETE